MRYNILIKNITKPRIRYAKRTYYEGAHMKDHTNHKRWLTHQKALTLGGLLFAQISNVIAADVILNWDQVSDPMVDHYEVRWGDSRGSYPMSFKNSRPPVTITFDSSCCSSSMRRRSAGSPRHPESVLRSSTAAFGFATIFDSKSRPGEKPRNSW